MKNPKSTNRLFDLDQQLESERQSPPPPSESSTSGSGSLFNLDKVVGKFNQPLQPRNHPSPPSPSGSGFLFDLDQSVAEPNQPPQSQNHPPQIRSFDDGSPIEMVTAEEDNSPMEAQAFDFNEPIVVQQENDTEANPWDEDYDKPNPWDDHDAEASSGKDYTKEMATGSVPFEATHSFEPEQQVSYAAESPKETSSHADGLTKEMEVLRQEMRSLEQPAASTAPSSPDSEVLGDRLQEIRNEVKKLQWQKQQQPKGHTEAIAAQMNAIREELQSLRQSREDEHLSQEDWEVLELEPTFQKFNQKMDEQPEPAPSYPVHAQPESENQTVKDTERTNTEKPEDFTKELQSRFEEFEHILEEAEKTQATSSNALASTQLPARKHQEASLIDGNNEESSYSVEFGKGDDNLWETDKGLYLGLISETNKDKSTEIIVVYSGLKRKNESDNKQSHPFIKLDHVLGVKVTNEQQKLIDWQNWKSEWILYREITPYYEYKLQKNQDNFEKEEKVNEQKLQKDIYDYVKEMISSGLENLQNSRKDKIPAAIRAWAEKESLIESLDEPMPLQYTIGRNNTITIPVIKVQHSNNKKDDQSNTSNWKDDLGLQTINTKSQFFTEFKMFLEMNAEDMPGTMAKKHELRNENVGGDRAKYGVAWLKRYDKNNNFKSAKYLAITAAKVKNIYVNTTTPTWFAYNQNVEHLTSIIADSNKKPVQPWRPSQVLQVRRDLDFREFTNPRKGEYFLFHGTTLDNIISICKNGFDPEFVSYEWFKSYGKTGYGTAFTDQFAKALAYSPPKGNDEGKVKQGETSNQYVLLARVFAGNYYIPTPIKIEGRYTMGNLDLTTNNINYDVALGNKPKAQGIGSWKLGRKSGNIKKLKKQDIVFNSTLQQRTFLLTPEKSKYDEPMMYTDTSLTIPAAIQMYPMFIIECEVPMDAIMPAERKEFKKKYQLND
ncbi:MAG: hypothetical protein F6J92_07985 [Symploca sp. SIO1A3]|nr:hypothetical protein [Symploca sp. SIO1A3]